MVTRRLDQPLTKYIDAVTESLEHSARKGAFYANIRLFYRKKWGCAFKPPFVQGVEFDLFALYEAVRGMGGWQKVSNSERWADVLNALSIDEEILVAKHAVQVMYMRYLSKYEQSETGHDPADQDSDLHRNSRLKVLSTFASSESPISIPRAAGNVSGTSHGHGHGDGSCGAVPGYHKLVKSLMSGLPNEVDFALNICVLASHPGPFLLRLGECPQLISVLTAHCCIFADGPNSLEDIHLGGWNKLSSHDFISFWARSGVEDEDEEVAMALLPLLANKQRKEGWASVFSDDKFDLKSTVNWRVYQVLSIFRNLSFEEVNRAPMASSVPLLKFLLACCNCRWTQLSNTALETLSNIAGEIDLSPSAYFFSSHILLKTVCKALLSNDKFRVLRALETLTGFASHRRNESTLQELIEHNSVLERIVALITAQDILLCTFSLEYLLQMSELGRVLCDAICHHRRAVEVLVDLATTDAASFGTAGLAGIKVVEIHGATGHLQPYQPRHNLSSSSASNSYHPPVLTSQLLSRSSLLSMSPPSTPAPLQPTNIVGGGDEMGGGSGGTTLDTKRAAPPRRSSASPPPSLFPHGQTPTSAEGAVGSDTHSQLMDTPHSSRTTTTSNRRIFPPATSEQQQPPPQPLPLPPPVVPVESELDRLTVEWLRRHCSLKDGGVASRGEMYASYVDYMQERHMLSGSMQMFIGKLKACFPSITIAHSIGSTVHHNVEGIHFSLMDNTDPKGEEAPSVVAQHPLIQQMLSTPKSNGVIDTNSGAAGDGGEIAPTKVNGGEASTEKETNKPPPPLNGLIKGAHNNNQQQKEAISHQNGNGNGGEEHYHQHSTANSGEEGGGAEAKQPPTAAIQENGTAPPPLTNGSKHSNNEGDSSSTAATAGEEGDKDKELVNGSAKSKGKKRQATTPPARAPSSKKQKLSASKSIETEEAAVEESATTSSTSVDAPHPSTSTSSIGDFMCEWDCCGAMFNSPTALLFHSANTHLKSPSSSNSNDPPPPQVVCRWPFCDGTPRSKWSMVTHLQDHHCSEGHLQAALRKRREMGHPQYMEHIRQQLERTKEAAHHPGYSKFAAIEAIRRHAFSYMSKDLTEDNEGPVTRSLRLTSSLILRNLAKHSAEGRRKLVKHESRLTWLAGSRLEASSALAQALAELASHSTTHPTIATAAASVGSASEAPSSSHAHTRTLSTSE